VVTCLGLNGCSAGWGVVADNTAYWCTIHLGFGKHESLCDFHLWEMDRLYTDI